MPEAVAAYAKAAEKIKDDADLYADYADALAMSQGRRIEGAPLELVKQALRIDPAHPKALAMAGTEAFNRKRLSGGARLLGKAASAASAGLGDVEIGRWRNRRSARIGKNKVHRCTPCKTGSEARSDPCPRRQR